MMSGRFAGVACRASRAVVSPLQRIQLPARRYDAPWIVSTRSVRYQAFESNLDPDELAEARKWRQSFQESSLPRGVTSFARSSGPGGQHVNKTESKALTTWPAGELMATLPKLLRSRIRSSKYYSKGNDSLSFQAQTQRNRNANADENRQKLFEELLRLFDAAVPGETSSQKIDKHKKIEKAFHENRVRAKKHQSAKKQSRRKISDE